MSPATKPELEVALTAESAAPVALGRQERRRRLMLSIMVVQTFLLGIAVLGGAYAYAQFSEQAQQLDTVTAVLNDPVEIFNNPDISKALARTLQSSASAFFLGSPDGSVVSFAQDVAQTDFAGIATQLRPFAQRMADIFREAALSSECRQYMQCPQQGGPVTCPNGKQKWCNGWNTVVNCADCPDGFGNILEIATALDSALERAQALRPVAKTATVQPAALSDGVFRLSSLLTWIENQGDSAAWGATARTASAFADNVERVDWKGNYTRGDGSTGTWDVNHDVRSVTKVVRQYAAQISQLGASAKKQAP